MDWKGFLKEIESEPRNFAEATVHNLNPPKYAVEKLRGFKWMCDFCWKVRYDICVLCLRSVCKEHIAKTIVGDKTKLEWYFCQECVKSHSEEEIIEKVRKEDEEFWLEDHMEEA